MENQAELSLVIDKLKRKSAKLKNALLDGNCTFQQPSSRAPEKLVNIGEESPLKDGSTIHCVVRAAKRSLNFDPGWPYKC